MAGLDLPLAAISLMCFDVLCGHGCVSRAGACGIECLHGDWRGLGAVMSWVISHVCVSHGCLWNGASTWMLLFGPWNRSMQAQQPNRNRNAIFNNPPSLWGTRSRFRGAARVLLFISLCYPKQFRSPCLVGEAHLPPPPHTRAHTFTLLCRRRAASTTHPAN